MFYSPDKLVVSYGVPAPTPAFVYSALGKRPLPTKDKVVDDTVDSIAARFNLRYRDAKLPYLYKFCSDYPGIRHAGTAINAKRALCCRDSSLASMLLLCFSGYLSPQLDERVVLGV